MPASDNIVAFPGRPADSAPAAGTSGRTSVRSIAAALSPNLRPHADDGRPPPLSIDLSDLTGIADETIGRLTIAAVEGYVTCASAARLAMRHARELRHAGGRLDDVDLAGTIAEAGHHDVCLRLALRADAIDLDMAVAPVSARDRIVESGFAPGPAVAVLTGRDLDGAAAFATVPTPDWRPALLHLTAAPDSAFAERVHLFRWVGALQPRTRRQMADELGRRIALHGGARRLGRAGSNRAPRGDVGTVAAAALLLVAATHPAIVDGSRP